MLSPPQFKIRKLLIIAFRRYITSSGQRMLCDSPETPTQWKVWVTTGTTNQRTDRGRFSRCLRIEKMYFSCYWQTLWWWWQRVLAGGICGLRRGGAGLKGLVGVETGVGRWCRCAYVEKSKHEHQCNYTEFTSILKMNELDKGEIVKDWYVIRMMTMVVMV